MNWVTYTHVTDSLFSLGESERVREEKAKTPRGLNCSLVLNSSQCIIFRTGAFQELPKRVQDGKWNMQSNLDRCFQQMQLQAAVMVHIKEDFAGILQRNDSEVAGGEKLSVLVGYFLCLCHTLPVNLCHIFLHSFQLPKTVWAASFCVPITSTSLYH